MKIYLFPFIFDFIHFLVFLRVADASGREMHLSDRQAAAFIVVFSLSYLLACPLAGHVLNRRNARAYVLLAVAAIMLLAAPIYFTTTFWPTLILLGFLGVAVAFAFNSFQTFMRGEAPPGSLGLSIARYTFAWSSGISVGSICGGVLKDYGGPWSLAAVTVAACVCVFIMVLTHRARDLEHESADAVVENTHPATAPVDARYVLIGWILCMNANFNQRPLTTFIPKFYAEQGHPAHLAGFLLCLLFVFQALGGYHARRLRSWLYRPTPLLASQILVVAILALLWKAPNLPTAFAGVMALGSLYGFLYFSCIYYVSNDLQSSRNVGINEAMVGIGNILGVAVSEFSMRFFHNQQAYYPVTMIVTLGLVGFQWWRLRGQPRLQPANEQAAQDVLEFVEV
jgi:predicted MFS family arabinose efflux permease